MQISRFMTIGGGALGLALAMAAAGCNAEGGPEAVPGGGPAAVPTSASPAPAGKPATGPTANGLPGSKKAQAIGGPQQIPTS